MPIPAHSRLTARILVWVVVAGVLMFSVVTALTVLQERERMYQAAREDAHRNVSRSMAAVSAALWSYDTAALNATLTGLIQSGSIIQAEVRELNRQVTKIQRADLETKPEAQWEVPIMRPNDAEQIGTLRISESYREVRNQLARKFAADLLSELIKIAGLAALLFIIIYRSVTRHLQTLARDVSNLKPGSVPTPITLQRKVRHDELDTLVDSINRFRRERADVENALLRDIAERKRVEATLYKTEGDLSEVAEASRHKSQFVANMSHELRTPLNAILGYIELILDNLYGETPDKMRKVLDRVQQNGRHLLGLINDVLDLSKIEAGKLSLTLADFSLEHVVHNVFVAVEPLANEKKLALDMHVPPGLPVVHGDEQRITQVLLNLLGNAIKFTDTGAITVTVATEAASDALTIAVHDTGRGISAGDQRAIFEEFRQVDSSVTKDKGGTGLGLAIARRLVEMHGGKLWVESKLGEGATFFVTLPFNAKMAAGS